MNKHAMVWGIQPFPMPAPSVKRRSEN
jgi:hypothetical protein